MKKTVLAFALCALMVFGTTSFNATAQEATVHQVRETNTGDRLDSLRRSLSVRLDTLLSQIEALQALVDINRAFFINVGAACAQKATAVVLMTGIDADGNPVCTDFATDVPPVIDPVASATYAWALGSWSACSAECDGTQTRAVTCQNTSTNATVGDTQCDGAKPIESKSCSTSTTCGVTSPPTTGVGTPACTEETARCTNPVGANQVIVRTCEKRITSTNPCSAKCVYATFNKNTYQQKHCP